MHVFDTAKSQYVLPVYLGQRQAPQLGGPEPCHPAKPGWGDRLNGRHKRLKEELPGG